MLFNYLFYKKLTQLNLIKTGSLSLNTYKTLKFEGAIENVESLLQGQITSDISELANNNAQLSCLLDHKGFIQADFILVKLNDEIYCVIEESLINNFNNQLEEFLKFYRVTINSCKLAVKGMINNTNDKKSEGLTFFKNKEYRLSILLSISENSSIENELSLLHWKVANKLLVNYLFTSEDINQYRPNEINYDKSRVSFTKGCYRGQEIVARVHHLGVNRREFVTIITPSDQSIDPNFKIHGEILEFLNHQIFNTHLKRDDLENSNLPSSLEIIRMEYSS